MFDIYQQLQVFPTYFELVASIHLFASRIFFLAISRVAINSANEKQLRCFDVLLSTNALAVFKNVCHKEFGWHKKPRAVSGHSLGHEGLTHAQG